MVDRNDTLLREVNEELRRERLEKLWERYGIYLIAAAALIVAVVGGYNLWDSRQRAMSEEGGARYEAALNLLKANKSDEAQAAFGAIIADGHAGYAALAQLQVAGLHLKAERPNDALAVFEKLATSGAANQSIKTFAAMQAASLRLEEADFTEMQNRLNDLANGTTPWRIPAKELLATAAYKSGKLDEARKLLLALLTEPEAPRGTTDRVQLLLGAINAAEAAKGAAAPAAPAPSATAPSAPAAPESGAKQGTTPPAASEAAPAPK